LVKWYVRYNLVCDFPPFWKNSPQAFRFVSHQFYFFERPAEEVGILVEIVGEMEKFWGGGRLKRVLDTRDECLSLFQLYRKTFLRSVDPNHEQPKNVKYSLWSVTETFPRGGAWLFRDRSEMYLCLHSSQSEFMPVWSQSARSSRRNDLGPVWVIFVPVSCKRA
jgi:hypothetical protein